ncbi:hypothetical protein [Amycolatopsis nigrescens]|uniref:hypothetical protein n=1 Tax=Amycolatopsis nigrescens TaxID=381445 RepID=UPI000367A9F2|nr:hypothetical protein [Amycolatopsis nigrescens]
MKFGKHVPVLAAVVAVLGTAGCATAISGTAQPAGAGSGEQSAIPKLPDRDMQAVTVALRKLDACQLLDLGVAQRRGVAEANTVPTGPHSCLLSPDPEYSPATDGIEIEVGTHTEQFDRYRGEIATVGGMKAYQYQDDSESHHGCRLVLPVSFTRGITLSYDAYDDVDACPVLKEYAEGTVAKLQNPDALTVDNTKRPFSAWDGCFFMAQLLGPEAEKHTYEPEGTKDEFSGCRAQPKRVEGQPPSAQQSPELEAHYDKWDPSSSDVARDVAGKPGIVNDYRSNCKLSWNHGDSGAGNEWFGSLVFELTAANCDIAAQLAEKVVATAGQAPSDADAKPQRPLLYKADENDSGALGACVDFGATGGQSDCEPFKEGTPVPKGTDELLAASDENRHVQCAVFKDTVLAVYGPSFQPITWGAHCFFVEPTHTMLLTVNVDGENAPGEYGNRPDLYVERQVVQVAGKQTVSFYDTGKKAYDLYVSPYNDLNRRGNVHIQAETLTGRGVERIEPQPDPAKLKLADQVITQVVQKYFQ